jgi:hypothetical protein
MDFKEFSESKKTMNNNKTGVEEDFGTTAAIAGGALLGAKIGKTVGIYRDAKSRERAGLEKPRKPLERLKASWKGTSHADYGDESKMKKEEVELDESIKTTHENPLVTVHDKNGLHTHANLSVANDIFGTEVKPGDVHNGEVKTKSRAGDVRFNISKHHENAMKEEVEQIDKSHVKKEETMPQSFKGFLASLNELTDNQKKIDKNHNGKLDAQDFKILRKEDSKCCEVCGMEEAKCKCTEMKEGSIEERNQQNATKRKMMDASRGAKFKLNNPVPDAGPEHKTAQAHNKALGRALRNEATKDEEPPFDGPYKKVSGDGSVKDKSGAVHTPMSRVRDLARKAMQKKMKEEFNIEITEEQAAELCDVAIINEKMDMSKANMGDVIKDFKKSDAPQFAGKSDEKRREMAIAAKMQADRGRKKSYREFVEILAPQIQEGSEDEKEVEVSENAFDWKASKAPASSGRYDVKHDGNRTVVTRKYNPDTGHSTGTDDDEKPASEKRGRGRPAGSTSGAKQKGSANKSDYRGIDYNTHALHLPNNNK